MFEVLALILLHVVEAIKRGEVVGLLCLRQSRNPLTKSFSCRLALRNRLLSYDDNTTKETLKLNPNKQGILFARCMNPTLDHPFASHSYSYKAEHPMIRIYKLI